MTFDEFHDRAMGILMLAFSLLGVIALAAGIFLLLRKAF